MIKSDRSAEEAKENEPGTDEKLRDYMCSNFYDIRAFGAVMTTL